VGDVSNYYFATQDDGFYAKWLAMGGESGIPIWWVGRDLPDGARLCTNPATCDGLGEHTCDGVLGTVQDSEIIVLACRGYAHDPTGGSMQTQYGTDDDNPLQDLGKDASALATKILDQAKTDPAGAEAYADGFPQGTIALLTNRRDFVRWQLARVAKDYANANKVEQLLGHFRANMDRGIMQGLTEFPSYGDAVDSFVTSFPEQFSGWVDYYQDAAFRTALAQRPAIKTALDSVAAGGANPAAPDMPLPATPTG
jgi:hypothetical protein